MGVKLGQKWAIKDGNLLASNQVGSRFFNKEFDFSRASDGTYIGRDGLLKTASLYNLIPYSEDFTQWINTNSTDEANATISPQGVTNATALIENTLNGAHLISLNTTATAGIYTASVFVKANGRNWILFNIAAAANYGAYFNLSNGTIGTIQSNITNATIEDVGGGWYRCSITADTLTLAPRIAVYLANADSNSAYTGDGVSGVYIYGAQLVLGTEPLAYQYTNGLSGLPRISFEDGVGHLLLEPQRSNLLLQSNQFDTTWFNIFSTDEGGYSGIYGSNDAWLITKNNGGGYVGQAISQSGITTFSAYIKANDSSWAELVCDNGAYQFFNLSNGTLGIGTAIDPIIESVGNGWYRCSLTQNASITRVRIRPAEENSTTATSGSIYIQHAQLEAGSYSTSIIETTTTSVTRLADVCNRSGLAQDFNSEEGTIFFDAYFNDADKINFSLSDSTSNNYISIDTSAANAVFGRVVASGTIQALISTSNAFYANNDRLKCVLAYKENDFAFYINGTQIGTDASGIVPVCNDIRFARYNGSLAAYQSINQVILFNTRLSNEECINLTT